jgi:hypothetical protein
MVLAIGVQTPGADFVESTLPVGRSSLFWLLSNQQWSSNNQCRFQDNVVKVILM